MSLDAQSSGCSMWCNSRAARIGQTQRRMLISIHSSFILTLEFSPSMYLEGPQNECSYKGNKIFQNEGEKEIEKK